MSNKYEWDFSEFCKDNMDFESRIKRLKSNIIELSSLETISLDELLKKYYELKLEYEKLNTYAELNSDLDITNEVFKNYKKEVGEIYNLLQDLLQKVNAKIVLLGNDYRVILKENEKLAPYKMHIYELLRCNNSVVDEDTKKKLDELTSSIQKINDEYMRVMNVTTEYDGVDIDGEKYPINIKNFNRFITSKNREIRELVFNTFIFNLKKSNKDVGELLIKRLKACDEYAKLKGYSSVLEGILKEDDLSTFITDSLVEVVNNNLDFFREFYKLKLKGLNIDGPMYYDLALPFINMEFDKNFDESVSDVKKALSIFGTEYSRILDSVFSSNSIDVFPKPHKFPGAYNFRNYTKPMILMNYHPGYVSTKNIAHECGHAVNAILIRDNHPYQDFHFSSFLSETASIVNENALEDYYIRTSDDKTKIFVLEQKISNFISTVFLQTLYFEFSKRCYDLVANRKKLTVEIINNVFKSLLEKYYGDLVPLDDAKYIWQTRIHLFYGQYRYYNFQYATGLINAIKIYSSIKNNEPGALNNYLKFLSIGGSMPTLDALKVAGVDYDDKKTIIDCMKYFRELLLKYKDIIDSMNADNSLKGETYGRKI